MKINKIALMGGAVNLAVGGMAAIACSSNPATTGSGTGNDSGAQTNPTDSGTPQGGDSGNPQGGDSGTQTGEDSGSTVSCAKAPTFHAAVADGGIYCPFSFNDATDAGVQYCGADTPTGNDVGLPQCCLSPVNDAGATSTCQAPGPCATSGWTQWQCAGTQDCTNYYSGEDAGGGPVVCCLGAGKTRIDPSGSHIGCLETEGLDSVTCKAASACAGSYMSGTYTDYYYVACESQADCNANAANAGGDGGTCTGIYSSGTPIGLCL
jgi:hypothetical protein